jgi:polysaccharide biosynthesis protein PelA
VLAISDKPEVQAKKNALFKKKKIMWLIDELSLDRHSRKASVGASSRSQGGASDRDFICITCEAALHHDEQGSDKRWVEKIEKRQLAVVDQPLNSLANLERGWREVLHTLRKFVSTKLATLLPFLVLVYGCARPPPSTAFFYGAPVPVVELSKFKRVVVEAENLADLDGLRIAGAEVFAYLSVGEAEGWRASARALPKDLFLGDNAAWNSRVADLTQPGWRKYLIEQRMAMLWESGYTSFFLDTLDSYQIVVKTPAEQLAQARALVEIIRAMHQRFPGVKLLLNRGFEVLPEVGPLAVGLVAESLFQSWNPVTREYDSVSDKERGWLLARLNQARIRYALPITVIDYVPADKPELARETAKRITALGFASWVANPGLDMLALGVGK